MGTLESTISPLKAPAALPNGEQGRKIVRWYFMDPQGNPVVLPANIWSVEAARCVSVKLDGRGLYHDVRLRSNDLGKVPGIWRSGPKPGWVPLQQFDSYKGDEDATVEAEIRFSVRRVARLLR